MKIQSMKDLKWLMWLCLICCICDKGYAQMQRVRGNLKTDTLLIVYRNWTNNSKEIEQTDTIIARSDGYFTYNFPDSNAVYTVKLKTLRKTRPIHFVSLPNEEAVITKWDKYEITGSGFYQRWSKLYKELDNLHTKMLKYHLQQTTVKDSDHAKLLADSSKMYLNKKHQKAWKYIKAHPDDPVSVMVIDYLKDEDKKRAYRHLSNNIKTGSIAAYAARFNQKKLWATSFLNQKAPEFIVEEWITKQPEIKGKFVLIDFWATWCAPCRAAIPKLNKLSQKFKKKMVVIGLSEQPANVVKKLNNPIIKYYNAVDTKAYMKKALEIHGIPHVIVVDPQWIVRWEGFPSLKGYELTARVLRKIIRQYQSGI